MKHVATGQAFASHDPETSEQARLAALKSLNILDTPPDPRLDRITRLASKLAGAPIALISLIDENRQWFKSKQGLAVSETERSVAFCDHAIAQDEPLIVRDARVDERFKDNPLVTGAPHIQFYAGWPLSLSNGYRVGTLCVIDHMPRLLSNDQQAELTDLAAIAVSTLELLHGMHRASPSNDAVANTRQYYRSIFDNVKDPLAVYEPMRGRDGRIVDFKLRACNDAAAKLRGNRHADLVGMSLRSLVPNLPEEMHKTYCRVVDTGETAEFEHHYKDDFYDDWFRVRASRTKDHAMLLQLSTLTQQKQKELQLTRSRDALNSFASVVSHDLRTPLCHISGFTEILKEDLSGTLSPQHEEYMDYVMGGVSQMRRLIDALQKHARLGEIDIERTRVDLTAMVEQLQHRFAASLESASAVLAYGDLEPVDADSVLLDQLLSNLISNSIRYRSPSRPLVIDIRCRREDACTIVAVRDNGIGIDPGDYGSIFELFSRGTNVPANDNALGIGLATCQAIAKAHGGFIRLYEPFGEGTTFEVGLPHGNAIKP
ncbi:MAG: ATP-binding protein [Pseudomonadota bacterium]